MTEESSRVEREPELLDSERESRPFLRKALRLAGRLPFVRDLVAMWYALMDDQTPMWARALVAGAIAYFVLPADLIPDFLAGLGFTDDAAVVLKTLASVHAHVKPGHYQRADALLGRRQLDRGVEPSGS